MPVAIEGALPEPGTLVTRPDGSEAGEIRSGLDGRALAQNGAVTLDTNVVLKPPLIKIHRN